MKFTKLTALVLALLLCLCAFAACGEPKQDDESDNGNQASDSTVSISIVDNNGNTIYTNEKLDVNLATDATEEGKLFIDNILALCKYYDDSIEYDYDETEQVLTINDLSDILSVTEQIQVEVEKEETEETEKTDEADEEPEYTTIDVEYCYYWSMVINGSEVSIDSEIKLGDKIELTYNKVSVDELLNE